MPIKFYSEAYFFQAWSSLKSLKSQTRDPHLEVPPGVVVLSIFTSWKIHRPQSGLNTRTLDLEASTLPGDHRGRLTSLFTKQEVQCSISGSVMRFLFKWKKYLMVLSNWALMRPLSMTFSTWRLNWKYNKIFLLVAYHEIQFQEWFQ